MKIKLAILEKDPCYLNRIVTAFSARYSDKIEIYSFTDPEIAMATLEDARIDVLVASDAVEVDTSILPKRCGFAYFVESAEVDTINNQRAICKFQRADLIYKQILSIYSENAGSISSIKLGDETTKMIAFSSPNGGVGTSSLAAACAVHFASSGKRVLYLNLERFGAADLFFSAEGLFDMSDIIYTLKSKKANLAMKLESCVKQDERGVFFYSRTKYALDMLEIRPEDVVRLISELKLTGSYDYILLDMDFSLEPQTVKIYKQAHAVVWVGDGSEVSNSKIQRAYEALSIREQNEEDPLTGRLCLIYNKFSSKVSKTVENIGIRNIGGAPVYVHAGIREIIDQIAPMNMFDNIV